MEKYINKKYIYALIGAIVLLIIVAAGAKIKEERLERNGQSHYRESRFFSRDGIENEKDNTKVQRLVVNTASGVDITLVTSDSGAISTVNAMFELAKGASINQNSAIIVSGNKTNDTLKISVTSTIPDVVKYIQTNAISGKSGEFGIEFYGNKEQTNQRTREGYDRKFEGKKGFKEGRE